MKNKISWAMQSLGLEMKSLKEYSDVELLEFLNNNESIDVNILSGICSEILRRQLNKRK